MTRDETTFDIDLLTSKLLCKSIINVSSFATEFKLPTTLRLGVIDGETDRQTDRCNTECSLVRRAVILNNAQYQTGAQYDSLDRRVAIVTRLYHASSAEQGVALMKVQRVSFRVTRWRQVCLCHRNTFP